MPELNNTSRNDTQVKPKKEYSTDEVGMMNDAKDFAKRDYKQTIEVIRSLKITQDDMSDEIIIKAVILNKYKHIKEARLDRITAFDHA